MNPAQKQFPLNREASRKQIPISKRVEAAKGSVTKPARPQPSKNTAIAVATIALGLAVYGLLMWGAFVGIRFAWGKAGEGIAWVKTKLTSPTPRPLTDWRSLLATPTPKPTSTNGAPKVGNELPKLSSPLGKPTPTPTPSILDPLPGSKAVRLLSEPTPKPVPPYSSELPRPGPEKPSAPAPGK